MLSISSLIKSVHTHTHTPYAVSESKAECEHGLFTLKIHVTTTATPPFGTHTIKSAGFYVKSAEFSSHKHSVKNCSSVIKAVISTLQQACRVVLPLLCFHRKVCGVCVDTSSV